MTRSLNPRERGLSIAVVALLVGGGLLFAGVSAKRNLDSLNSEIAQLEQELINLTQQNAQRSTIEAAYRMVVAEHSSEMTQEEIHDNLRREIFRLARVMLPGKDGAPARPLDLVKIQTLREGQLKDVGEGVREYQIQFRVPSAQFYNVMHFMERIETSGQILRIDAIDIARAPDGIRVQTNFVITRTVLHSPSGRLEENARRRLRESTAARGDV